MASTQTATEYVTHKIDGDFPLDQNIIDCLPLETKILTATAYGYSLWTRTARITTKLQGGTRKDYFLKCSTENGRLMMEGEYTSLSTIYSLLPSFVVKPLAWGRFSPANSATYFLLTEFISISPAPSLPPLHSFCSLLATLHSHISPTGKFGFHMPTCHGKTAQPNTWDSNWTTYFTALISRFFERDVQANGHWVEYEAAFQQLVRVVIPQILDPLSEQGRSVRPVLVHGDLWEGNTATDALSGEPLVFDAACMFAHNEYEIGMWRREIIKFGEPYIQAYHAHIPRSEPVEMWDDRNALYSLKFKLSYCLHRPGLPGVREQIYKDILELVDKFPPLGWGKWGLRDDELIV